MKKIDNILTQEKRKLLDSFLAEKKTVFYLFSSTVLMTIIMLLIVLNNFFDLNVNVLVFVLISVLFLILQLFEDVFKKQSLLSLLNSVVRFLIISFVLLSIILTWDYKLLGN